MQFILYENKLCDFLDKPNNERNTKNEKHKNP